MDKGTLTEERWKECLQSDESKYRNKSVYCKKREGYVSPKWCDICPDHTQNEKKEMIKNHEH